MKGRKRHLLVDTQGLVLKAKVYSASIMDWDGIKMLLRQADVQFPAFLTCGWIAPTGVRTKARIGWRRP